MKRRDRFGSIVGPGMVYRHALFYYFPGGLRFELAEGGSAFDEVLTALRKASLICEDVFAQEASIHVHLQMYFPSSSRFQLRHTLRELGVAGLAIPRDREIWLEQVPADDKNFEDRDEFWINVAFEVPKTKLQSLIWCAVAIDFEELRPNPQCLIYLINPAQEIIIHPYDDRGMDIIGGKKEPLKKLYDSHKRWLLQYDIEAMNQTFSDSL